MKKYIVFCFLFLSPFTSFALEKEDIIIETARPSLGISILEKAMDDYIASEVSQFKKDALELKKDFPELSFIPSIYIDYEIATNDKRLVSVVLNQYVNLGGAHGIPSIKTFVYIPAKKKMLNIKSTKFLEYMSKKAIPYFTKKLEATDEFSKNWIKDGLAPTVENWNDYTLQFDEKGKLTLTFYFEPYQIAAYALGTQTLTIDGKGKIIEPEIKTVEIIPDEDF